MAIYIQYMFPRDTQTRDFDAIQSTCVLELYGNNRRLSRVYVAICPFIFHERGLHELFSEY